MMLDKSNIFNFIIKRKILLRIRDLIQIQISIQMVICKT